MLRLISLAFMSALKANSEIIPRVSCNNNNRCKVKWFSDGEKTILQTFCPLRKIKKIVSEKRITMYSPKM